MNEYNIYIIFSFRHKMALFLFDKSLHTILLMFNKIIKLSSIPPPPFLPSFFLLCLSLLMDSTVPLSYWLQRVLKQKSEKIFQCSAIWQQDKAFTHCLHITWAFTYCLHIDRAFTYCSKVSLRLDHNFHYSGNYGVNSGHLKKSFCSFMY